LLTPVCLRAAGFIHLDLKLLPQARIKFLTFWDIGGQLHVNVITKKRDAGASVSSQTGAAGIRPSKRWGKRRRTGFR
jgi:hypothetical protein